MTSTEICNCKWELSLVFSFQTELSKTAQERRQELKTKPIELSCKINGKASKTSFRGVAKLHQFFPLGSLKSDKATYCLGERWMLSQDQQGCFLVPRLLPKLWNYEVLAWVNTAACAATSIMDNIISLPWI